MRRPLLTLAGLFAAGCGALWLGRPDNAGSAAPTGALVLRWAEPAGQVARRTAGPCLEVGTTVREFGRVLPGRELEAVFPVRNTGTRRLILRDDSCACTDSVRLPPIIPPGESGNVTIDVRAAEAEGAVRRSVTITTNDPRRPRLTFRVVADVTDAL